MPHLTRSDGRWLRSTLGRIAALALAIGLLCPAEAVAQEELLPARRFKSARPLDVVALVPSAWPADCGLPRWRRVQVGATPSGDADGIEIPTCRLWGVVPPSLSDPEVPALVQRIRRPKIPGLSLPPTGLTDDGLAELAKAGETLRWLHLDLSELFTAEGVAGLLQGLPMLERLTLVGELSDELLEPITNMVQLRHLEPQVSGLSDASLGALRRRRGAASA